jgi:hypothetical protein
MLRFIKHEELQLHRHPEFNCWELRLEVGELFMTQVCKSDREIENVSAGWRDGMIEKGWAKA